jgi:hypothetical protein
MTHTEFAAMAASAAMTGTSTFVMQQTLDPTVLPVLTPLISASVGGGIAYGIMKATMSALRIEIQDLKAHVGRIHDVAHKTSNRVSRIEGKLHVKPPEDEE